MAVEDFDEAAVGAGGVVVAEGEGLAPPAREGQREGAGAREGGGGVGRDGHGRRGGGGRLRFDGARVAEADFAAGGQDDVDGVLRAVAVAPARVERHGREVAHDAAVEGDPDVAAGLAVGADLEVRRGPDVVASVEEGAELLQQLPVAVAVELVAVAPDVEEEEASAPGRVVEKGARQRDGVVLVVGARLPADGVLGDLEGAGDGRRPRVGEACLAHGLHRRRRVLAVGGGVARHGVAEKVLEGVAAVEELRSHLRGGEMGQVEVVVAVRGDLVAGVERPDLVARQIARLAEARGRDVEGALEPVGVQGGDKAPVRDMGVVVGEGDGPALPVREGEVEFHKVPDMRQGAARPATRRPLRGGNGGFTAGSRPFRPG